MNVDTFEFFSAGRVLFGAGSLEELPKVVDSYGRKALVVRSPFAGNYDKLAAILEETNIEHAACIVDVEPSIETVNRVVEVAQTNHCDFVIGIGGGSVIDTAKATAAVLTNGGELIDYLEVVGKGKIVNNRCAPLVAIPTTAGTGSEVTRNAVITIPDKRVKVSMRSNLILPWVVIVDPRLTLSIPPQVTASTGMDAFIQVIEPYVSSRANLMTDILCLEGISKAAAFLRRVYYHGDDLEARTNMCFVSLMGGLALANAGLGAVHGIASVIGGMYPAPHGEVCASLLTAVMRANISALMSRTPESRVIQRYERIAHLVTGNSKASFSDGIEWFIKLCQDLEIPRLKRLGVKKDEFPQIVISSKLSSSIKSNPIELTDSELLEILETAY